MPRVIVLCLVCGVCVCSLGEQSVTGLMAQQLSVYQCTCHCACLSV